MERYGAAGIVQNPPPRSGRSASDGTSSAAAALIWKKPTYLSVWLVTALAVGGLYAGVLTEPGAYDAMGWIFALTFPILMGAMLAVLVANYREQKACPVTAAGSGLGGSVLGIFTVGCSTCPAILLSWIGLGTAVPSAFLASPWLKLASLVLLIAALFWAGKRKLPAS